MPNQTDYSTASQGFDQQIIIKHTERCFSETPANDKSFTEAALAPALSSLGVIDPQPASADLYKKWLDKVRRQVNRIMKGEGNLNPAWNHAWVSSLPEPYRLSCRKELVAAWGSHYIPLDSPVGARAPAMANIGQLMIEVGEVMQAAAPAADGVYDPTDRPEELQRLANELFDVLDIVSTELRLIEQGTGVRPERCEHHHRIYLSSSK